MKDFYSSYPCASPFRRLKCILIPYVAPGHHEDFAQGQMGGQEGDEPQHAKPKDDIEVLVDPGLWLLVVETVNQIDVDREVGVDRMGARGWSEQISAKTQSICHPLVKFNQGLG